MARSGIRSSTETKWMRIRKWLGARAYLVTRAGTTRPKDTILVMDYLRGLAAEPCGRIGPRSVRQILAFVAVQGGAHVGERVSVFRVHQYYAADLEVETAAGAPPKEKAERLPFTQVVMATELVLKFRRICETAPAPWPPPAHGRSTTSGKVPEALVGLGVLQEVLIVPLPGLGPVKFLSGQVEGITA